MLLSILGQQEMNMAAGVNCREKGFLRHWANLSPWSLIWKWWLVALNVSGTIPVQCSFSLIGNKAGGVIVLSSTDLFQGWLMYINSNFIFLSEHNILFIFQLKCWKASPGFPIELYTTKLSNTVRLTWIVPVVVFQINIGSSKGLFHCVTGGISDLRPHTLFPTHNRRTKQSTAITFKDQGLLQNV